MVTRKRDDRLDPEREARAAVRQLSALHARYNDWPLTLAAYNAGEGRVDRALARHPDATLWELVEHGRLPPATREYVPRFLAVVRVTEPTGHCVTGPEGRSLSPDTTAYRSQPAPS